MTVDKTSEYSKWNHDKECPVCGEEFIAKRRDHKYCDVRCKQIAYNARKLVYKEQFDDRNELGKFKSKFEVLQAENIQLKEQVIDIKENLQAEDNANAGLVKRLRISDELNEKLIAELKEAKEKIIELEAFINDESVED